MSKLTEFIFSIFMLTSMISCSSIVEQDLAVGTTQRNPKEVVLTKDSALQAFAKILSKATAESKEVRAFLKKEALQKMDNDFNIFYPIAKEKTVGCRMFGDLLKSYESKAGILEEIERSVPLLNIHIPEIGDQKVASINVADNEIPVMYKGKLFFDGNIVDSLSNDEIPGFHVFVVTESSSIKLKRARTRSGENCTINDKYEFVDQVFNPNYTKSLTRASVEYDEFDEKYSERGYVPKSDIDPLLIETFNKTNNQKRATRYLMYYGLSDVNQAPTSFRTDIRDCLFRFKIAGDAFVNFEDVANGVTNDKPLFNGSTENKIYQLSREEVLKRLLTGRAFCFLFIIEGSINGQKVSSESMKIYASPEKIFNLRINEHRRHPTTFRHTKYTYTIDKAGVKSKWFYPLENGHDTRFNRWDIRKDPLEKKIIAYLINPDQGKTFDITNTYSVTHMSSSEAGGNLSISELLKKIGLAINGKLTESETETTTVTVNYKVTPENERIDDFQYNYFDDYPIEGVVNDKYMIPVRQGRGAIETSIMPISNAFFNVRPIKK